MTTRIVRPARPALTCQQTGSARSTGPCMAAASGACGYCGLSSPAEDDRRLRVAALLDEASQFVLGGWR